MFTGIVEARGQITALTYRSDHTAELTLRAPHATLEGLEVGGSLSVSGICLTAIKPVTDEGSSALFTTVAMGETLARTTLGELTVGSRVNLERCTRAGDRLDGHVVQGHVDGVGRVTRVDDEGSWRRIRIEIPQVLAAQTAEKGAVALDGVSLTITAVSPAGEHPAWLEVALIPETLAVTTLGEARVGTSVNVETDVLAKYTARLAAVREAAGPTPPRSPAAIDGPSSLATRRDQPQDSLILTPLPQALARLRAGDPVVVLDDEDRENEGDLILAAELATQRTVGFMIRHTSGYLCAPMSAQRAAELGLPLMVSSTEDPLRTAYTISCDARAVEATGISAADRATTARTLSRGKAADLIRPGHVLPLIARDGGVRERPGHTEAAVDLLQLAGLAPVGLIGEVVHDDGSLMRAPNLAAFAREHDLAVITIAQLIAYLTEEAAA